MTRIADIAARFLRRSNGALRPSEARVLAALEAGEPVARDAGVEAAAEAGLADRLADRVAAVGGSWSFIIGFAIVLFGWMLINTGVLQRFGDAFDPIPTSSST